MKKLLFFLLIISSISVYSQSELHCGTDEIMKKYYDAHPEIKARIHLEDSLSILNPSHGRSSASFVIPIVFHVLHLDGPENISDEQVVDAVRILNRDYAKQNPDTVEIINSMKQVADSTGIQFVLATLDPNGDCTNGIVHYYDFDTDWNDQSPTIFSYTWDPTKYLNVYVVRSITLSSGFGAAGYAFFPGPPGVPNDAIVILNNYFGSIGTGTNFLSRVLTHEVGHWLNLRHVWGGSNAAGVSCFDDDNVFDTPQTAGFLACADANDSTTYQLCTPGVDENFQNYMDYSYCVRMFTHGQGDRMQIALQSPAGGRDNLSTPSNLVATGVTSPSAACIPNADFKSDRSVTCVGVPVTFADASWNGKPTTYSWTFPSGSPGTSVDSMPIVIYNTPGTYSVTLMTSNAAGFSVPITKTNFISVVVDTATYKNSWTEGFENSTIPNNDWTVFNSSGGGNWQQSFDAAFTGNFSAKLTSTTNTRRKVTSMTSPSIDISTFQDPFLTFHLAAAEADSNHVNNLSVYSSVDCGQTWEEIYSKTGQDLVTSSSIDLPFIPFDPSEWREETISLSGIASATSARFKFVYSRDTIYAGNNVFIDDINIYSTLGTTDLKKTYKLSLFPNPSHQFSELSFVISNKAFVQISVFDLMGKMTEKIVSDDLSPGKYQFKIGANKDYRASVYFVILDVDGQQLIEKLVIE